MNIVFTDGIARTVTYDVSAPSLGLLSIDLTRRRRNDEHALDAQQYQPDHQRHHRWRLQWRRRRPSGRGALNQSAGTVTTNAVVGDLVLGCGAGSTGVYTLSGGALVNNLNEYIGLSGTGTFNHSGGSNTINASAVGFFSVGHNAGSTGTYNLSGTAALSTADRRNTSATPARAFSTRPAARTRSPALDITFTSAETPAASGRTPSAEPPLSPRPAT